jgi:uncharacterized protein YdhG (YjbR/CyaY superfamily)
LEKPQTIDEYISAFPESVQALLEQLRKTIHTTSDGATESISYKMPCFQIGPKSKIWIAAYKNHIGMYPIYGLKNLEQEIVPYRAKRTKDTLHFKLDQPLPLALIEKIVKHKMQSDISH